MGGDISRGLGKELLEGFGGGGWEGLMLRYVGGDGSKGCWVEARRLAGRGFSGRRIGGLLRGG